MKKNFYYFLRHDGKITINQLVAPCYPYPEEHIKSFLIYAETEENAFKLAMEYIYEGREKSKFYGTYKGERYEGLSCVM